MAAATKDIHKHTSCIGNARDSHINLVPANSKLESSWYSCDWPADPVSGYDVILIDLIRLEKGREAMSGENRCLV
jgi:hypothetical protein